MQKQYTRSIGMKKISLKEGDRLCKICYYRERARFEKLYSSQGESMEICDKECFRAAWRQSYNRRWHTQVLRRKIDDAYKNMLKLCCSTTREEENSGRSDDLKLSGSDSDTLIEGLQALFNHSSGSERIRLLTLAPPSWGRKTIVDFFRCTQHQARAAIELRLTDGILAFPVS
ncbi:unnamed protein product [Rotaria magnacalcarata]